MLQVHKFGGASVKDAKGIRNVVQIISQESEKASLIVVISAIGKTTNHLEKLADLAVSATEKEALEYLEKIIGFHRELCKELFAEMDEGEVPVSLREYISGLYRELHSIIRGLFLLGEIPPRIHDRIMAYGELLSSRILHYALQANNIGNLWIDARKLIVTDASYQKAYVRWDLTSERVRRILLPAVQEHKLLVVPGYISATEEGKTTTLGREGSDFSGAILASLTEAASMTVWKDVPGVLAEDPRENPQAELIKELSYDDALKLTFFGAKILHPKTIAPLKRKQIPLYIKSFVFKDSPGTVIKDDISTNKEIKARTELAELVVLKKKDYNFITPKDLSLLFSGLDAAELLCYQTAFSGNEVYLLINKSSEGRDRFLAFVQDIFSVTRTEEISLEFHKNLQRVEGLWLQVFSEQFRINVRK